MTALAKILSFPSNSRICQCIGSDKTVILQTSGYCTHTVSFTDLETPPEWESVFCLHTTSRNVQYKQSWAELSFTRLPFHPWGVEVSWRPQHSPYQARGHSQCHFIWQPLRSDLDVVVAPLLGWSLAHTTAVAEEEILECGAVCAAGCTLLIGVNAVVRGCRIVS